MWVLFVGILVTARLCDAYQPTPRSFTLRNVFKTPPASLCTQSQTFRATLRTEQRNAGRLFGEMSAVSATGDDTNGGGLLKERVRSILKHIKRVVMSFLLSFQLQGGRFGHKLAQSAIAIASVTTMMPMPASASLWHRYSKLAPMQKLATTPLYFVSNSGGSPYLQEDVQAGNPNQRIVVYFMSSEDANDYLNEMAQGSPQNINEFRITAVSMEKVMAKIQDKKQSRKLGRLPLSIVYRIQPSSRQCANAEIVAAEELKRAAGSSSSSSGGGVASKFTKAAVRAKAVGAGVGGDSRVREVLDGVSIPMFSVKGMVIQRGGGLSTGKGETVTPYYFAYEDLREDWTKLVHSQNSDKNGGSSSSSSSSKEGGGRKHMLPSSPRVAVYDFTEVMCLARGITHDSLGTTSGSGDVGSSSSKSLSSKVVAGAGDGASSAQIKKKKAAAAAAAAVGVVPPRREIEMIRKYYRNEGGLKNEFSRSKILKAPR